MIKMKHVMKQIKIEPIRIRLLKAMIMLLKKQNILMYICCRKHLVFLIQIIARIGTLTKSYFIQE